MRVFIELSFDGYAYHGWQKQPNGITVQEELESALSLFTGTTMSVMGCGRTDAGVHASYFVAHAVWPEEAPRSKQFKDWEEAVWKLNGMLPKAIALHKITEVDEKAHARFDATERGYVYHMHTSKDPFLVNRSARIMRNVDFSRMQEAAPLLIQKADFAAFCKSGADQKTTICDVRQSRLVPLEDRTRWIFEVSADRFLRNMVRAMVGTLLEIGQGRIEPEDLLGVLDSKDRSRAGASAPADGLYLNRVVYPDFEPWHVDWSHTAKEP
jgi:tRNA pseudouridine38-40 synthase